MNSVGGQFRLVMDKADMKRLVNGAGEGVEVRFSIKAKRRKEASEKWIVLLMISYMFRLTI
jgi:hypothetical protein